MISDFEADLENNLYKLWNRLSSGSYFPPPVRRVDIPKSDGRMRPLGIPTVADRIAQMVVKRHLEPLVEPQFHPDSYGYRCQWASKGNPTSIPRKYLVLRLKKMIWNAGYWPLSWVYHRQIPPIPARNRRGIWPISAPYRAPKSSAQLG